MDVHAIKAVWDHYLLIGSEVAFVFVAICAAAYMLVCAYHRMGVMAKRIGWVSVAVLFSFCVWATITGTPTQEEKEDALEQEQGEAQTNAMYGAMLLGFGSQFNGGSGADEDGVTDTHDQGSTQDPEQSPGPMTAAAPPPAFPDPVVENEIVPGIRPLTIFDHAAGFALSRIGTGEVFDFSAPEGATVCEDWLAFGASRDWFKAGNGEQGMGNVEDGFAFPLGTNEVNALTVFSNGTMRPRMKRRDTFVSPLETALCVVPSANWPLLDEDARPSRFWHYLTSSNTLVMTWQNALLDQLVENPVSFQTEFFENGDIVFRYDLSRLADTTISNLVVGIRNVGYGRVFTQFERNITSLHWTRLDPLRANDSDPDGDGVSTDDEVLVYHTDPYSSDTDMDMLSDYDEINLHHTDPNDPNSVSDILCDGMAKVIGDLDPFSCPEGSTNTVLEHVFYTGTTNTPFAYPVASESTAVLYVTVSGSGSGRLVIGDRIVPLLARPRPRLLVGANGLSDPTATTLRVPIFKGTVQRCFLRIPESLEVAITASDFVYGQRPTFLHPRGWFAFPNTEASHPCIHDLNARRVAVSLDPGFAAPGLSCVWNSTASVGAVSTGDLSATLFGHFSPSSTAPVTYTLSHPQYICGRTDYTQTVRYCPRVDDDSVLPEGDGERSDEEYDRHLCGDLYDHSGCMIPNCDCPCHLADLPSADSDCDVHHCPYSECESLHRAAYEASNALPLQSDLLLLLRDPPYADSIALEAPPPGIPCCPCPEHHQSPLALAAKSFNLAVSDAAGAKFVATNADCTVSVRGLSPSHAIGDSVAVFCKTGVVSEADIHRYTVLGVRIESDDGDVDVKAIERQNSDFGLPVVIKGENPATYLRLNAAVRLSDGDVHLAFTNATARFRLAIWNDGDELTLLDTEGKNTLDLSILKWRSIAAMTDYGDGAVVMLYASGKGHVDLDFGYAMANGQSCIRDSDRLRITAINPPLLPDYNRDGRIDAQDMTNYANGAVFRYWTNQDTEKGESVGESSDVRPNLQDDLLLASVNGHIDLVNLFPLALDLNPFVDAYGDSVTIMIRNCHTYSVLYSSFADVPWRSAGSVQTNDVQTVDSSILCTSPLVRIGVEGLVVPNSLIRSFAADSGLLVTEAPIPVDGSIILTVTKNGIRVMQFELPILIRPVREMYRFYSLRGAEEAEGDFDLPSHLASPGLPNEKDQDIFFTHGFNVSEADSHKWGGALFKRLWLMGSNARFNMVTWRGNYHWTGDWANGLRYPHDVWFALRTAGALKRLIEREQPDSAKRILMTQSLGNMVACEALRQGLHVGKYFMFDAAVATEAIDASLQNDSDDIRARFVPSKWRDYDPLSWSANWFRWFVDDPDDARGRIGWPGRFTDALGNATEVYNYYSTGDEVFHETEAPPWLLEGMGESSANYCWQKQEVMKGSMLPAGTMYGGWRFYEWESGLNPDNYVMTNAHYSLLQAAAMVADGSVTNNPVFNRGFDPMFDRDMSQDDQWLALAKYVPAVSHPVGGNPVTIEQITENINMNLDDLEGGVLRPNGWGRSPVRNQTPWLHSDMKDMAFFYVYKLYEQLIQKGNLK